MALGRPGVITALQLTGLLLVVPLMFVLVPRFGLVGAGLSLLLSTTVRLIVLLASFPIVLKIPMPEIVPSRDDMTFILGLLVRGVSRRPRRLAFEGAE
jgi:O-antigen/teichoic acid export membrane protein